MVGAEGGRGTGMDQGTRERGAGYRPEDQANRDEPFHSVSAFDVLVTPSRYARARESAGALTGRFGRVTACGRFPRHRGGPPRAPAPRWPPRFAPRALAASAPAARPAPPPRRAPPIRRNAPRPGSA